MTTLLRCLLMALLLASESCRRKRKRKRCDSASWNRRKPSPRTRSSYAKRIIDEGDNVLYLSGYAYHDRGTYSAEKIAELRDRVRRRIRLHADNEMEIRIRCLPLHSSIPPRTSKRRSVTPTSGAGSSPNMPRSAPVLSPCSSAAPIFSAASRFRQAPSGGQHRSRARHTDGSSYIPKLAGDGGNGNVLYLLGRIDPRQVARAPLAFVLSSCTFVRFVLRA